MKTKVVNFISGAGAGKSLMSALTFAELKMRHIKQNMYKNMLNHLFGKNVLMN